MQTRVLALGLLSLATLLSCQDAAHPPTRTAVATSHAPPVGDRESAPPDSTAYPVGDSTLPDITPDPVDAERLNPNVDTRIVLHAVPYGSGLTCMAPQQAGLDCATQTATTTVNPLTLVAVYVYLIAYETVSGVQLTFSWDPSWTFEEWRGSCQTNALEIQTPSDESGDYVAAFRRAYGGSLIPLGRLIIDSGLAGTMLSVTESPFPGGTGVITSGGRGLSVPVPPSQRGAIGVLVAGVNTCQAQPPPRTNGEKPTNP